jgi:hypothetical protein
MDFLTVEYKVVGKMWGNNPLYKPKNPDNQMVNRF